MKSARIFTRWCGGFSGAGAAVQLFADCWVCGVPGLCGVFGASDCAAGGLCGVSNSAWTGSVMGLVATVWLSLIGFYVVKNAIQRDRQTRVGKSWLLLR